jgi:hypothetical protein
VYGFDTIRPDLRELVTRMQGRLHSVKVFLIMDHKNAPDGRIFAQQRESAEKLEAALETAGIAAEEILPRNVREDCAEPLRHMDRNLFALNPESRPGPAGDALTLYAGGTPWDEAEKVSETLRIWHEQGIPWNEMAIALPSGAASGNLLKANITVQHINNSAGIMNFDECFDMCRMGIILYGLYPSHEVDKSKLDIRPVMQWKTHISHIKTLPAGREISYGGTYVTTRDTVVATVPVGYADGYPRCLSNCGRVILHGRYAPILGRVCMDQFMVDVTDIPGVMEHDEVVLIGEDGGDRITFEEWEELTGLLNYELSCHISARVPRFFV